MRRREKKKGEAQMYRDEWWTVRDKLESFGGNLTRIQLQIFVQQHTVSLFFEAKVAHQMER
jgi:hypothetical protein